MKKIKVPLLFLVLISMMVCGSKKTIQLEEKFKIIYKKKVDLDSLAYWRGKNRNFIFVTDKLFHMLRVLNADTGKEVMTIGSKGESKGSFIRPNGIMVLSDPSNKNHSYLFVVERDSRRVQIFLLDRSNDRINSIYTFGKKDLIKPYGITGFFKDGKIHLYITDSIPGPSNEKVKHYIITKKAGELGAVLQKKFAGDNQGFANVESILADTYYKRLFVCNEITGKGDVKVFGFDGKFTGKTFGNGMIEAEPEGIVMIKTGKGEGIIIVTDQSTVTAFLVFDRKTLAYKGRFTGKLLSWTDGICLSSDNLEKDKKIFLYAVHHDKGVFSYDLDRVIEEFVGKSK